ncbi:hypothetical protein X777_01411 [Ooceraea biroi]|uniref:Uncharacterized protein n=1 Tax=Ooceraea biroi TaxID=2015173 RepID=A0A026WPS4_OOCBI|nr:hypothetical protein X777_01411 [Ooceraea biroi]
MHVRTGSEVLQRRGGSPFRLATVRQRTHTPRADNIPYHTGRGSVGRVGAHCFKVIESIWLYHGQ